eukprot:COSAG02_NODE_2956_length_7669_cov_10.857860_1_plen_27_part_10
MHIVHLLAKRRIPQHMYLSSKPPPPPV